jgi:hypothetical protein
VPGHARMHGAGVDGEQGCEAQHLGFDCGFSDAPLLRAHSGSNARDEAVDGATVCAFLVRDGAGSENALALRDEVWSERWGGFGLVALAQRVRGDGAGLEVDGFLQQARDALHLEFDCATGDAPLVSAAHDAIRPCGSVDGDATWDALLIRFVRAAFVLLLR